MINNLKIVFFLCALSVFNHLSATETTILYIPSTKYEMSIVSLTDNVEPYQSMKYIIVLSNGSHGFTAYRKVEDFKNVIKEIMREEDTLEWWPSDVRMGDELLLSSEKDLNKFIEFCDVNNINLTIHPGG